MLIPISASIKARVLARMEHPGPPLPETTCLRSFPTSRIPQHGDPDHISHKRIRARARHGLHHKEIEGIWVFGANDAVAYRGVAENQVREGQEAV